MGAVCVPKVFQVVGIGGDGVCGLDHPIDKEQDAVHSHIIGGVGQNLVDPWRPTTRTWAG